MKKILFFILLLLPVIAFSQEIIVKSFKEAPATSIAKTTGDIPKTNEGEDAAVVIVKVHHAGLSFEGRILTDEQHPAPAYDNGEYTVYMAPRSKSLTIKIPGYPDQKVNVTDYSRSIPDGLLSRRAYELYLQVVPKGEISGRNLSFGISGGYLIPSIKTSADNFAGSPINYGNYSTAENAKYTDAHGFVIGINADIRLHKFLFLSVGLDFGHYTYKNSFSGDSDIKDLFADKNIKPIPVFMNAMENYEQTYIEIPILASYRYSLTKRSNIQIGLDPVINYGLKAKCKFGGEAVLKSNNTVLPNGQILRSITYSGDFDLYSNKTISHETYYYESDQNDYNISHVCEDAPFRRFGLLAGAYLAYEFHGLQLSLHYRYMLTNCANEKFWSNPRLPSIFFENGGMPNTSIKHNYIQIKIGYTLRY